MSQWEDYLDNSLPQPTAADRAKLEAVIDAPLPDGYWQLASRHQGQVLEDAEIDVPGQGGVGFGVLLLPIAAAAAGTHGSYCIETVMHNIKDYYPAGLMPFADDTGGNQWAFDFRVSPATPGIVFIDHEIEGEDGLTAVADNFDAFMASFEITNR